MSFARRWAQLWPSVSGHWALLHLGLLAGQVLRSPLRPVEPAMLNMFLFWRAPRVVLAELVQALQSPRSVWPGASWEAP